MDQACGLGLWALMRKPKGINDGTRVAGTGGGVCTAGVTVPDIGWQALDKWSNTMKRSPQCIES
jgi:hypothetical protein